MNKQRVLEILASSKPELASRFGVTHLALFGSTARDAASGQSDVGVLVDFDGPATSKRYFGVQFYLEDKLGCPVDLVTPKPCDPSCGHSLNGIKSMSDASGREWCFYLDDIIRFAERAQSYASGIDQAGFAANVLAYDATLRISDGT